MGIMNLTIGIICILTLTIDIFLPKRMQNTLFIKIMLLVFGVLNVLLYFTNC